MPVNTRIQLRRGTAGAGASQWTNQVLYAGEVGFETDTGKFKIGDGTTAWNSLGYASVLPTELNELIDDRLSSLLVAGSNISLTYDDSANTLTIATDGLDTEQVEDIIGTKVVGGSNISVSYDDTTGNTTISVTGLSVSGHTHSSSDITDFSEAVDDRVNNLLVAGTGVSLSYNDNSNTLTISSSINAGSGISVTENAGTYTVSLSDPTIQVSDITDLTASAAELNILDGVTSSASEINLLDGSVANTVVGGKAVVYGSSGEVAVTSLSIGGTTVTSSAAELNILDGVTSSASEINLLDGSVANTVVNGKAVVYGTSGEVSVTSLNIGGTAITSSGAELNILDGVTADYNEINLLDGAVANTVVNSKAVVYGSSGQVAATTITTTGDVTVGGNLVVNGSTTTVNSTVTTLDDPILTLGGDTAPASDDSKDRGIEFRYYSGSAKIGFFGYDNSTGKFTFVTDATNTSEAFSGTVGEIDAKVDWSNVNNKPDPVVTVTLSGDVTGTANTTLTDLASGTINLSTSIAANSVALGTDTTGDYVASVSVSGTGLSVSGTGEGASVTVTSNATNANTASTIVARDASGNFSAGTITADLTGTASNASNIEVDASSSNINHLVFVYGSDGNLKPSVNSNLRFDAENNELLGDDSTTPTTKLKYFVIDGGTP